MAGLTPRSSTPPALYASSSIPPHGQNNPRFVNDELTRLLEAGSAETDEAAREELYRRIQDILVEEAPVIPLFWYTAIDPVTTRLQNFRPNATQSADTWNAAQWYLTGNSAELSAR